MTADSKPYRIKLDEGDSYVVVLPDGTTRTLGYTAEGPHDNREAMEAQAKKLYEEWADTQGFALEFQGLTTSEGKPFVAVLVDGVRRGQLSPREITELGLRAIQAGIEAERDAGFLKFMRSLDPSDEGTMAAAVMLKGLRDSREQHDPADPK